MTGSNQQGPWAAGGTPGEQPRLPRKNLLLSATVEAEGLSAPVRIRNLSISGAMLDGGALPEEGVRLALRRASIEVAATVVWRAAGRCGVKFDEVSVSVDEWVAGVRAPSFNGQQGQARVDAIQGAVRSGAALPAAARPAPAAALTAAELDSRVVEEILYVQRLLDGLGEELVEDAVVLQRHLTALQNLDRASQVLEHLSAILSAPDRVAAVHRVKMEDLKARLLRRGQI